VEGELDDISGSGQTAAAHDLCTGIPKTHRMHYEAAGAGHYGIFSGRRWREFVHPVVKTFLKSHQPTVVPAPVVPAVAEPKPVKAVSRAPAKPAVKAEVKAPAKAAVSKPASAKPAARKTRKAA
jgi:poly(3-hydroxybutyrate) depolymerase